MLLLQLFESQRDERVEFLKKQLEPKWGDEGLKDEPDLKKFVKSVAAADPTPKGIYMQWIARLIMKNQGENKIEDLKRLKKDLTNFEKFKPKLEKKDINTYKTFSELYTAIDPFLEKKPATAKERSAAALERKAEKAKSEIKIVYKGAEGWVRIPTTKAAAALLGQSTRWCTSARSNNMFDSYNARDSLFVIYEKSSQRRWQLHIDSGQFCDEKDVTQNWDTIPEWARKPIYQFYKKENSDLSLKQLMKLKDFAGADDDHGKGSGHEDLFALMKLHGL